MPLNDHSDSSAVNFRERPDLYRAEHRGALRVEPYRSEIRPHWRVGPLRAARASADAIYALYLTYRNRGEFVGMDVARKFLRLGCTRASRGKGVTAADPTCAEVAALFREKCLLIRADPQYRRLRAEHHERTA
jgi:Domain of unknown function (DUF4385)